MTRVLDPAIRQQFRTRLKALREARGWSMSELGRRAGMRHSTISLLEAGGRGPGLSVLVRLARALGVTVGVLLGEEAS